MKPNIGLLYASWGWGHKKAALALQEAFEEQHVTAEAFDLLTFLPQPFSGLYSAGYSSLVRYGRGIWQWIYKTTNNNASTYSPANSYWQKWQFNRLKQHVRESRFTHIISTHFLTSALLADWKNESWWNSITGSVVTDYHAHRYWIRDGVDRYFVPSDTVCREMTSGGIPASKISVTGIPVSLRFTELSSRSKLRREFQFADEDAVVLVLSSGLNLPATSRLVRNLQETRGNIRFLLSAGKDAPQIGKVKSLSGKDERIQVFGIAERMADFMKASDVLVSKPGGIVMSESLAIGLPQIILPPIPGQEEANAQYLVHVGAGVPTNLNNGHLKSTLQSLLASPQQLDAMSRAAAAAGRPNAAREIANLMLNQKK